MSNRLALLVALLCVNGVPLAQTPTDCMKAEKVLAEAGQLYGSGQTGEALKKAKSEISGKAGGLKDCEPLKAVEL